MDNNIFLISDASYSYQTRCAGLAVVDMHSKKKYTQSVCDLDNVTQAEFRALALSAKIALHNRYDNVVFVYDNKYLELDSLKTYLDSKNMNCQFLWLKRVYVKEADSLANKARRLQEKLNIDEAIKKKPKRKKGANQFNHEQLLEAIRQKPIKKIIKFCTTIADGEEKRLVNAYFTQTKLLEYNPSKNGVDFLMFMYRLLPKDIRKNFFAFVRNRVQGHSLQNRLIKQHQASFYESRINQIASILQKDKNDKVSS